jgi:hypothetical protein
VLYCFQNKIKQFIFWLFDVLIYKNRLFVFHYLTLCLDVKLVDYGTSSEDIL